jgi:methylamine--corrinoid protein Co-methyltransferase
MVDFLDLYERSLSGPIMSEKDFDIRVFMPALKKVVREYEIRYDGTNPVSFNDQLADNLYQASVDFLSQVGVYCLGTNRIIQFGEHEVREAVRDAPGQFLAGEGKEARVFSTRKPDDPKLPWFHTGSGIVFNSDELAMRLVEGCASIPQANSVSVPAKDSHHGLPCMGGSPAELYAAIERVRLGREAVRRAGRPGLPIMNLISTAATSINAIAASAPQFGCRPTDGWLCGTVAEMKMDFGVMDKLAYLLNWGANIGAETSPILGGYCGGPSGTAVVSTAYVLMGLLVHKANYQLHFPIHFNTGCTTSRDVLWVVAASCQAASRNIPMPVIWNPYCSAGPNTRMYFYESAAWLLCAIPSGAASFETAHPSKAVRPYAYTPMEAKFGVQMGTAAAKIRREQANELVIRLLGMYETQLDGAPVGSTYQECFDVATGKPSNAYLRLYDEVVKELTEMGIPFE